MSGRRSLTEVPDVVGLDADDACAIIRRASLVPYGPNYEVAPTTGVVTAQRPTASTEEKQEAPVFLWTTGHRDTADVLNTDSVESASPL